VFQNQLRHLAELGAFKGIVATDEEKDAMLALLRQKHAALETAERTLKADRATLDRSSQSAVDAYNERVREHQAAVTAYNRRVEEYNLMISYPDGLARERSQAARRRDAVRRPMTDRRLIVAIVLAAALQSQGGGPEWTSYAGDPGGTHFSPLTGIDRDNVARLGVAWEWKPAEQPMRSTARVPACSRTRR
jgi:hypothetical protein